MRGKGKILPKEAYLERDVVKFSQTLLGKVLVTHLEGQLTAGVITETEAYRGPDDLASHASGNRRTNRTEVLYKEGGRSYVYLCYGIHHLLNVVTNSEGIPHGVLIRKLYPLEGVSVMAKRRKVSETAKNLTDGPGALSQALGVTLALNDHELTLEPLWIEERGILVPEEAIEKNTRIGVDYAGKDALLPWRFTVNPAKLNIT